MNTTTTSRYFNLLCNGHHVSGFAYLNKVRLGKDGEIYISFSALHGEEGDVQYTSFEATVDPKDQKKVLHAKKLLEQDGARITMRFVAENPEMGAFLNPKTGQTKKFCLVQLVSINYVKLFINGQPSKLIFSEVSYETSKKEEPWFIVKRIRRIKSRKGSSVWATLSIKHDDKWVMFDTKILHEMAQQYLLSLNDDKNLIEIRGTISDISITTWKGETGERAGFKARLLRAGDLRVNGNVLEDF